MKIRPVGADLFHVDGRTNMMQLIVRNFANAPKISSVECEYETTLEQLLTVLGTEARMSFPTVISIVNDAHSAAHNQISTQNYVQDKIKMLSKSYFSFFSTLLSRHTKKN